ncbi:hypothetical protein ADUPG1_000143, partial [Aduncisulcus paluster]
GTETSDSNPNQADRDDIDRQGGETESSEYTYETEEEDEQSIGDKAMAPAQKAQPQSTMASTGANLQGSEEEDENDLFKVPDKTQTDADNAGNEEDREGEDTGFLRRLFGRSKKDKVKQADLGSSSKTIFSTEHNCYIRVDKKGNMIEKIVKKAAPPPPKMSEIVQKKKEDDVSEVVKPTSITTQLSGGSSYVSPPPASTSTSAEHPHHAFPSTFPVIPTMPRQGVPAKPAMVPVQPSLMPGQPSLMPIPSSTSETKPVQQPAAFFNPIPSIVAPHGIPPSQTTPAQITPSMPSATFPVPGRTESESLPKPSLPVSHQPIQTSIQQTPMVPTGPNPLMSGMPPKVSGAPINPMPMPQPMGSGIVPAATSIPSDQPSQQVSSTLPSSDSLTRAGRRRPVRPSARQSARTRLLAKGGIRAHQSDTPSSSVSFTPPPQVLNPK